MRKYTFLLGVLLLVDGESHLFVLIQDFRFQYKPETENAQLLLFPCIFFHLQCFLTYINFLQIDVVIKKALHIER